MSSVYDIGILLRNVLESDETVRGLLCGRIYPNVLPPDTSFELGTEDLPAATYQMVDCTEQDASRVAYTHWYITCYAKEQKVLNRLCSRVKDLLQGYKSEEIRYTGLTNSSMEFDDEVQMPYCVMTYQITFFRGY